MRALTEPPAADPEWWDRLHRRYERMGDLRWSEMVELCAVDRKFDPAALETLAVDLEALQSLGWKPMCMPGRESEFWWTPPEGFAAAVAAAERMGTPPPPVPEAHGPPWWENLPADADPVAELWRRARTGYPIISPWVDADDVIKAWAGNASSGLPHRLAHLAGVLRDVDLAQMDHEQVRWTCPYDTQVAAAASAAREHLHANRPEQQPWVHTLVRWSVHCSDQWIFAMDDAWVTAPLVDVGIEPPVLSRDHLRVPVEREARWSAWSNLNVAKGNGSDPNPNHGDRVLLDGLHRSGVARR